MILASPFMGLDEIGQSPKTAKPPEGGLWIRLPIFPRRSTPGLEKTE